MGFASHWKFLTFVMVLGAIGLGAESPSTHLDALTDVEAPTGSWIPIFRATGVVSSDTVATTIHCTNLGSENGGLSIWIRNWNGTLNCQISPPSYAPDRTITVSSNPTLAYFEEAVCPVADTVINQGSLAILANPGGSVDFRCTVQVLDSQSTPPDFSLDLDLYDGEGNLLDDSYIFSNGFESGSLLLWTGFVP